MALAVGRCVIETAPKLEGSGLAAADDSESPPLWAEAKVDRAADASKASLLVAAAREAALRSSSHLRTQIAALMPAENTASAPPRYDAATLRRVAGESYSVDRRSAMASMMIQCHGIRA